MQVERLLQEIESFGRSSDVVVAFREAFETLHSQLQMTYESNSQENIHELKFLNKIEAIRNRLNTQRADDQLALDKLRQGKPVATEELP